MYRTIATLVIIATPSLAWCQATSPVNVIGTVSQFGPSSLSVVTEDNNAASTFTLTPKLLVLQNKSATLSDIKPNDFVASAAARGPDGKLHSIEVRIYPEALRGTGEGQRPMDEAGTRTMTNATVTGTAVAGGSNRLTVSFSGGQSELVVNPGIPVIRIESVDPAALRPGLKVRVQGVRGPDGATANRITIME